MSDLETQKAEALFKYVDEYGYETEPMAMIEHFRYLLLWEAYSVLKKEHEKLKVQLGVTDE